MKQLIRVPKKNYVKDAILIALQKYLDNYWVMILTEGEEWILVFEKKGEAIQDIDEKIFFNELVEAEFLAIKEMRSEDLRRIILKKTLSPYVQGR